MTVELRVGDFEFDDTYVNLGGRIIARRDILSVVIQKRTSGAFLAYCLICVLLTAATLKVQSFLAVIVGSGLAAGAFFGARYEWQNPYVLVLTIYQLGMFEVVGIAEPAMSELARIFESE